MKWRLSFLLSAFLAVFAISCSSTHNPVLSNAAASFHKPPSLTGAEWLLTDLPGTTVILTSNGNVPDKYEIIRPYYEISISPLPQTVWRPTPVHLAACK